MQAKRIEPNRIELQRGMAQEVFDRIGGRGKTYYIETSGWVYSMDPPPAEEEPADA